MTPAKRVVQLAAIAGALFCGVPRASSAQMPDVNGGQDHPLLPRVTGYYISQFKAKASGEHVFCAGARNPHKVRGAMTQATYRAQPDTRPLTGSEIRRHYREALVKAGVRLTCDLSPRLDAMLLSEGREIWVDVSAEAGDAYQLFVVEREPQRSAE